MRDDVIKQLIDKIKTKKIFIQVDETTIRGGNYFYWHMWEILNLVLFASNFYFVHSLNNNTNKNIYDVSVAYFYKKNIPLENIVSCVVDGTPAIIGKKRIFEIS